MIFICFNFAKNIFLMKKFISVLSVFASVVLYQFDAQVVVKNDTLSGTPLSIAMDSSVNSAIEDMEDNCTRSASNVSSGTRSATSGETTTPKRVLVANRELTTAEICRKNPRIMGVKIQLTVVKSNEEANEVKAYFRRRFPNLKVETDASLRPNYKVLARSYFSKQSAAGDLAKIRQSFKSAIAVPYRVFCVEAK